MQRISHHSVRYFLVLVGLLLSAAVSASGYDKGLLWKVEQAGSAPSYIFGTIHSEDPRVLALAPPVRQAFKTSRSFTMEVVSGAQEELTAAQAMFFRDGRNLQQILGAALFDQVARAAATNGLPREALTGMKPWAVMLMLSVPPPKTGIFLDKKLQMDAQQQGKQVYGLETMAEQLSLFDGASMPEQIHMLKETLKNYDKFPQELEELKTLYLARDVKGLLALNNRHMEPDDAITQKYMRKLLDDRNHSMTERMQPRLREGKAFVAVGALHLPGAKGILKLLEQRGYRITPVY